MEVRDVMFMLKDRVEAYSKAKDRYYFVLSESCSGFSNCNELHAADISLTARMEELSFFVSDYFDYIQKAVLTSERKNSVDTFRPEILGRNLPVGCLDGRCKCGTVVRSFENFCSNCGVKLDWEER